MAVIHLFFFIIVLSNTGVIFMLSNVRPRIIGDWWNPCGLHEDYDLCPHYQCVSESCLHFLGLSECQNRGENMPCRAECRCTKYYYRNPEGKCIPQHDCVSTVCGNNEIFKKCHPCNYADISCPNADPRCKPGCYCKAGFTRDVFGECLEMTNIEQTEIQETGFNKTLATSNDDDMIDKHDEDTPKDIYNMLVLPKSEKTMKNETDLSNLTTKISQTSFKILPIDIQLNFNHQGKSTPLIFYSNTNTTSTKNSTKPVTPTKSTSYIYKYFTDNNTQNISIDNELTTITINTIDDEKENDTKITTSVNDTLKSTSKKPNEKNSYKYIRVSLMDNLNRSAITKINNMTSNQTVQNIDADLSDIHVTTTIRNNLDLTTLHKDYNTSLTSYLAKKAYINISHKNASLSNTAPMNYTTSNEIVNTTHADMISNDTNLTDFKNNSSLVSFVTPLIAKIISTINSTDKEFDTTDYESTPSLTSKYYRKSKTTFLFDTVDTSSIKTTQFTNTVTVQETTTNLGNVTNAITVSTIQKLTSADKDSNKNIISIMTPLTELNFTVTPKETIITDTVANVTTYSINLMPIQHNGTNSKNQIEKKYNIHSNTSKIPSKGLNYIW